MTILHYLERGWCGPRVASLLDRKKASAGTRSGERLSGTKRKPEQERATTGSMDDSGSRG